MTNNNLRSRIIHAQDTEEYLTDERCHIKELSNSADHESLSVALARVEPGVTTAWHSLIQVTERYLIIQGNGMVELGDGNQSEVSAGDLVEIPAGCRQRITNTGQIDLCFYAVCTPRYTDERYVAHE